MTPEPGPTTQPGRLVNIDVLRGLAILWVMTFHLYADMMAPHPEKDARHLYPALRDRLAEGAPLHAITALGELVLSMGYQGVPMFMILSGLSLTFNSYRRAEPPLLPGYVARARKLLQPYWFGVAFIVVTVALIALLQTVLDGGGYRHQGFEVKLQAVTPVNLRFDDALYAFSVIGWIFREKVVTIPVGSLWFVQLLLLYYAVFPFALRLLNRIGPWRFFALTFVLTLLLRAALIAFTVEWMDPLYRGRALFAVGLFRGSEFFMGMSAGYLLARRREQVAEWISSPLDVAGIFVIGLLLQLAGTVLGPKAELLTVLGDPVVQVALLLLMLPLIFKSAGRFEASPFATVMAFVGVVAYAALIVNDQMRYVASFLRQQDVPRAAWWAFLVAVYIPAGTLLAHPLARFLGLLPARRLPQDAAQPEPGEPQALQPASGG
ncbi:MAG: acyltransferase [Chloroflexi bacterium]|nr:acyltransferase [Chloroflexota bacterium]